MISCSILFSSDELLRMEELSVSSKPHLIDNSWLEINKNSPGNMFSGSSFREEGVERIIASSNYLVGWHSSIRLNSMLQAVELPTGIANLATSLANVDRNSPSHCL